MNGGYTIGKIGFKQEGLPLLQAVFETYIERDPLGLPDLFFELRWLGGHDWPRVGRTATHGHFLVRWATLEWLERIRPDPRVLDDLPGVRTAEEWLARLAEDVEPLVRAEACYLLAQLRHERRLPVLATRADKRRARREVEKIRPSVPFEMMRHLFLNSMTPRGARDYTVAELETFVDNEVRPRANL